MSRVKIVTFVPTEHADAVRRAIGVAGAGRIGKYTYCSYSVSGIGRFLPASDANPYIGAPGEPEVVPEERIEIECDRAVARDILAALRQAHPYEEIVIDIYQLLDEDAL